MTATDGLQAALERATGHHAPAPDTDPGTEPPALNSDHLEDHLRAALGAHTDKEDR